MKTLIKLEQIIRFALLISALFLISCSKQNNESDADLSTEVAAYQSADAPALMDDAEYLVQLALMRGHLLVGKELYNAGHVDHAKMHMKHPESELYGTIKPVLNSRGDSGFAEQLQNMAQAVELEKEHELVESAYIDVVSAIRSSETLAASEIKTLTGLMSLISSILEVAAEEYAIAVVDGKMQNAHEYQDAYGFTQVAGSILKNSELSKAEELEKIDKAIAIISGLEPLWPSLVPPEFLQTEAVQLYEAASKIKQLTNK